MAPGLGSVGILLPAGSAPYSDEKRRLPHAMAPGERPVAHVVEFSHGQREVLQVRMLKNEALFALGYHPAVYQKGKRILTGMLLNVNHLGNGPTYNLGLFLENKNKWSLYIPPWTPSHTFSPRNCVTWP